jgi:hypothetical protein
VRRLGFLKRFLTKHRVTSQVFHELIRESRVLGRPRQHLMLQVAYRRATLFSNVELAT